MPCPSEPSLTGPDIRRRNVILIGFMGTGKTSVGRKMASGLGFRFVDTDDEIVRKAGKPIPRIFAEEGEAKFREMETAVLREAVEKEGQVISTGGGIVTIPANRAILSEAGFVVWLQADVETILERVSRNENRPLVQTADPRATIEKLLDERQPFYQECAHLEVNTSCLTLDETVYGLQESALLFFQAR